MLTNTNRFIVHCVQNMKYYVSDCTLHSQHEIYVSCIPSKKYRQKTRSSV